MSIRMGRGGGLEICHAFADSNAFKQQIYCSFLRIEGLGVGVGERVGEGLGVKELVTFLLLRFQSITVGAFRSV